MQQKEIKEKLASLGFNVDKLLAAFSDEKETDFEFPSINNISDADLELRDNNVKAESKKETFAQGKAAGIEIAAKMVAKKHNLPANVDVKNLDAVLDAISANAASGDDGLKEQIKLLQKDNESLSVKYDTIVKESENAKLDASLIGLFPSKRDGNLTDAERLILVKNSLQFDKLDNNIVVKKNGEILRHGVTKDPVTIKDALNNLFTERKWVSSDNAVGRGGANTVTSVGDGGIKKYSEAKNKWLEQNPNGNVISPECNTYIASVAKSTTDFDWHN